jgi:hypothetical protein
MFGIHVNCVTVLPLEYRCPVWVDLLNKNNYLTICTLNCFMGRDGTQINSVTLHDNCYFGMTDSPETKVKVQIMAPESYSSSS